jgi:hypothetical protein
VIFFIFLYINIIYIRGVIEIVKII